MKICSVENCERTSEVKAMCRAHYRRMKRGQPLTPPIGSVPRLGSGGRMAPIPPEDKFWKNVPSSTPGECWNWGGQISTAGYGRIQSGPRGFAAHRVSWSIHNGPIPGGAKTHIDHICHNTSCVNPEHLRPADATENNANRRGPTKVNSSGYRNVHKARGGAWDVKVRWRGETHYAGRFYDIEEANAAGIALREKLHGEFFS